MTFRKLFLITLLPAAMALLSCGPKDVVNPVTPPSTDGGGGGDVTPTPTPPTPSGGDAVSMTVCTFNIRYCMPLIPLCAMGLALVLQRSESSQNVVSTWFRRSMYALSAAFCCMSYVVYTQVSINM